MLWTEILSSFINPEIIETAGEQTDEEGCLSIPGKCASVTRADYVKVKSFDMELNPVIIEERTSCKSITT